VIDTRGRVQADATADIQVVAIEPLCRRSHGGNSQSQTNRSDLPFHYIFLKFLQGPWRSTMLACKLAYGQVFNKTTMNLIDLAAAGQLQRILDRIFLGASRASRLIVPLPRYMAGGEYRDCRVLARPCAGTKTRCRLSAVGSAGQAPRRAHGRSRKLPNKEGGQRPPSAGVVDRRASRLWRRSEPVDDVCLQRIDIVANHVLAAHFDLLTDGIADTGAEHQSVVIAEINPKSANQAELRAPRLA